MKHTQTSSDFNLSNLTRQQTLIASFALSGLTYSELARRLKISSVAAKKLCMAKTVPPHRAEQMVEVFKEYGLSADLVPVGLHITPGPAPKRPRLD